MRNSAIVSLVFLMLIPTATSSTLIFNDSFDDYYINTSGRGWSFGDMNSAAGNDYWYDSSYRSSSGFWSVWSSQIGSERGTVFKDYLDSLNAWSSIGSGAWSITPTRYNSYQRSTVSPSAHNTSAWINRSVNMSGCSSSTAKLSFYLWQSTETNYDNVSVVYLNNSIWYVPWKQSGNYSYWQWIDNIDIPATATSVGFAFDSDINVLWEGAYIDDVKLTCSPTTAEMQNTYLHTYDDNMSSYLQNQVNLQGYMSSQLSYAYWLDVEESANCAFDCLKVQTSSDGSIWTDKRVYSEDYDGKNGDQYSPYARRWWNDTIDLSAYDGSTVFMRFLFKSDTSVHDREGAYIDDVKVTGTPSVTVSGTLKYSDNNGENQTIKRAKVELWDADASGGHDCLAGCTSSIYTNDNGYYSFSPIANEDTDVDYGPLDIYLKIYAENPSIARVINATGGVYVNSTSAKNNTQNGPNTIDQTIADSTTGAYNIFSKIVEGYDYITAQPATSPPSQVVVMWYPDNTDGSHYHPGGQIHIIGTHQWERDIIVHEYGHYLMYSYYENSWVPDVNCPSGSHWFTDTTNPRCAYVEGWATFFEASVKGVPTYTAEGSTWNLESDQHPSSSPPGGENVEGAVTNALWDINDSNNDGRDTLYLGFDEIWDTFKNYETSNHHIYDINEFWSGWFNCNTGCSTVDHNYRSQMNNIFWDHGINKNNKPTATITSPNGGSYSGMVTVSASASDTDGSVSQVSFGYSTDSTNGIDGNWQWIGDDTSSVNGWSVIWDTAGIIDNSVWVNASAYDSMEWGPPDSSDSYFSLNLGSDSTPPSFSFISLVNNFISTLRDIIVSWTASDQESGISHYEVRLTSNDTGWINIDLNTSYTFYNASEGNHTFYLKAIDNANNTATETRNFTVNTSYVAPASEPEAHIHVFFPYGIDLDPGDTVFADILLHNEGDTTLKDGIRITINDQSGIRTHKTWRRVEMPPNDIIRIRFRDYKLPADAQSGIWMLKVEFTEDAKWTPPGFRYFKVS